MAGTDESIALSAVDELPSREDRLASALGSFDHTFGDIQQREPSQGYPNIEASVDEDTVFADESEIRPRRRQKRL